MCSWLGGFAAERCSSTLTSIDCIQKRSPPQLYIQDMFNVMVVFLRSCAPRVRLGSFVSRPTLSLISCRSFFVRQFARTCLRVFRGCACGTLARLFAGAYFFLLGQPRGNPPHTLRQDLGKTSCKRTHTASNRYQNANEAAHSMPSVTKMRPN